MRTILIGGYYGAGNLGDEAILECMLKDMRALRSDLHFIVTSWNPTKTAQTFDVESVHWQDISALLEAGKRADLILLGGGGLFQDYWGIDPDTYLRRTAFTITTYGSLPLLAKLLGIPCMIYAQGVGPLKSESAQEHVRLAFERCQVITLRDEESLTLLQRCGFSPSAAQTVEITADPAFTLEIDSSARQQAEDILAQEGIPLGTNLISVSLRYWDLSTESAEWLSGVAAGLNAYLAKDSRAHILFLPFQIDARTPYTDDRPTLQQVRAQVFYPERTHLIEGEISPRCMQAVFERSALVIGMRLHALILAINAGVPIIALPYDSKVTSLLRQLHLEE
ncbi:MAG: polysaccharide pyruvyl transferase CsaB, partial [Anaerolineales bacterium]